MTQGKEYVIPFLVVAVVLVGAAIAASWTGFFIALVSLVVGGVVGAYVLANEVQKTVDEALADQDEQPFPFL